MSFKIVVDSCCDLTGKMLEDTHFVQVPLTIRVDNNTFVDDGRLDRADLLWCMKQSPNPPSTACPSPQSYLDAYGTDVEDIYVVTLSALLSGSHNCAEQARVLLEEEHPNIRVHVFNSYSAASGEVRIALKIRELAAKGVPFAQVVEEVEQFIYRMETLFVLESLENLRKNGRLTKLQAILTGTLKIKLFLGATPEGEIQKLGQALTVRQALGKLVDKASRDPNHVGCTAVLCHCGCPERAVQVKGMLEKQCQFSEILLVEAGGISTVYANEGGIILSY